MYVYGHTLETLCVSGVTTKQAGDGGGLQSLLGTLERCICICIYRCRVRFYTYLAASELEREWAWAWAEGGRRSRSSSGVI